MNEITSQDSFATRHSSNKLGSALAVPESRQLLNDVGS